MSDTFKYSNKVQEKSMVALSVYNVGRQKCDPLYEWGPGLRDHYLIHYIISGKGTYKVGDQVYELSGGDAFLVYPQTIVSYQADAETPWEYRWVGFAGADATDIIESTDFSPACPVLRDLSYGEEVRQHLGHIDLAFGNSFENAVEMTGELYLTLSLFVKHATHRQITGPTGEAANVSKAISYIESNYSYPISIEDVAGYIGVSRSTLFRQFVRTLGQSPKEYLMNYRIRKAKFLLRQSDLPVGSVAASVGFDNSLYFSKAFRKSTGKTPSGYRENVN